MKTVELKARRREALGKGPVKRLRIERRIPGILYGSKLEPIPLEIDLRDFERALRTGAGENVILSLKIEGAKEGKKEHTAIIKEIQLHPILDSYAHVDFNAISLTEKIRVKVPVHTKGEAPGVKEGGVVEHVHREVEVECLPTEIPERLEVSIDQLQIGDSLHVRDLAFPAGVLCILNPEEVLLTVLAPMKEEVAPPVEEAPKEPEVIGKKKEEAVEAEGAAAEKPPQKPPAGGKKE